MVKKNMAWQILTSYDLLWALCICNTTFSLCPKNTNCCIPSCSWYSLNKTSVWLAMFSNVFEPWPFICLILSHILHHFPVAETYVVCEVGDMPPFFQPRLRVPSATHQNQTQSCRLSFLLRILSHRPHSYFIFSTLRQYTSVSYNIHYIYTITNAALVCAALWMQPIMYWTVIQVNMQSIIKQTFVSYLKTNKSYRQKGCIQETICIQMCKYSPGWFWDT